jgi:hypothetical protein
MLIPLDGSKVAEQALPYARALAKTLMIPAELLEVVDPEALAVLDNPQQGRHLDALLAARTDSSKAYLELIAGSFEGIPVKWFVETGKAEEGGGRESRFGQRYPDCHGHARPLRNSALAVRERCR